MPVSGGSMVVQHYEFNYLSHQIVKNHLGVKSIGWNDFLKMVERLKALMQIFSLDIWTMAGNLFTFFTNKI